MRIRTLITSFLITSAIAVSAQMPPGMRMPSLGYNPALLLNPAVQKDMNISPALSGKLTNVLMTEGMKMMSAMGSKKGSGSNHGLSDIMAANERMQSETLALLTPSQRIRYHEISLQSFGATALLDPKIAAEIHLTPKQTSQLQTAIANAGKKANSGMAGTKPDPSNMSAFASHAAEAAAAAKKESEAALRTILTPTQLAKWKKLQGRPIALKGAMGMGGMFGGL